MPTELKRIKINLTESELLTVKKKADKANLTVANYFRAGVGLEPLKHGGKRDKPAKKVP
jgi:hypothetical protein